MSKKWTQSLTIVGGLLTMTLQSLIGFDVVGADASESGNAIIENILELARNVAAFATIVGARRAMK